MIANGQPDSRIAKLRTYPRLASFPLSRRVCPRAFIIFCFVLLHMQTPVTAAAQEQSAGEYELKAAVLYNLTQFVQWPSSNDPDPRAPFQLCVLGWDPFGNSLTSITANKSVNGRPLAVRRLRTSSEVRACNVLYISSSERQSIVPTLASLKSASVLTVGEMSHFADRGGMVQFTLEEKRVRFDINLDAASNAGLKISSRLLVLARIVKEQSEDSRRRQVPWAQAEASEYAKIRSCDPLILCSLVAENHIAQERVYGTVAGKSNVCNPLPPWPKMMNFTTAMTKISALELALGSRRDTSGKPWHGRVSSREEG